MCWYSLCKRRLGVQWFLLERQVLRRLIPNFPRVNIRLKSAIRTWKNSSKHPQLYFGCLRRNLPKITTPRLRHSPRRINGAGKRLIWKRFAPSLTMAPSPSETGPGSVPCRASRQPGPSVRSLVGFYYEGVPCGPALPCDWFALLSLAKA